MTRPHHDRELNQLYADAKRLFGEDACGAANNRAYDRAAFAIDGDSDRWAAISADALKDELSKLLRPH